MMGNVAGSTPRIPGAAVSPKVSELQAYGTGLVFVKGFPLVHGVCIFKRCAVRRCVVMVDALLGAPNTFIFDCVFFRC